ncbi:MAG: RNA 3'-phosphate cyclase [Polyangiaceae bacterium UTPRO1]|nr:RNA 3'-terminal phosphate cyclase [Myxococcales bacterium]OQY68117.1 MAG: RNA 3'-phosphate cyclase [Polyangiaceae bacterium UTPRO1]
MLEIDGSYGEGGGQLVRLAVALSAATGRPVVLRNVRAARRNPGLAPQHLAAVRAVASLADAEVDGAALRSLALRFVPGALRGGEYRFDVGTAGSITLVFQALLPVMVVANRPVAIRVAGGSDVRQSPCTDYFVRVLLPLLARMGIAPRLEIVRRGYYPLGGGELRLELDAAELQPLHLGKHGTVTSIEGCAHVANLPEHIAIRMRSGTLAPLAAVTDVAPEIAALVLDERRAHGAGGAIAVWARTTTTVLGAGRAAERGVRAEALGTAVGAELAADIATGATVDLHAADQLLVFLALAGGGSYLARAVTSHMRTAMWLIEKFLPVEFTVTPQTGLVRVEVATR